MSGIRAHYFYIAVRWIISLTALITSICAFNNRYRKISLLILIVVFIFNPIVPLYFSRKIWQLIDLLMIVLFIFSLNIIKEKPPC